MIIQPLDKTAVARFDPQRTLVRIEASYSTVMRPYSPSRSSGFFGSSAKP
jgi:hypothetical protein